MELKNMDLKNAELRYRTEAHVDLAALAENIRLIKSYLDEGTDVIAVVKDDAYGHGIGGVYETMKKSGVARYAVGFWPEGKALRDAGCTEPIHVLSDTRDDELDRLIEYDLMPSIYTIDAAEKLSRCAVAAGKTVDIDIAFDTGMNRIGFMPCDESLSAIKAISQLPGIRIAAAHTHFANADEEVSPRTDKQFALYMDMVKKLEVMGIEIPYKHVANSASIVLHHEVHLDGVRAGDILFGLCPFDEKIWNGLGFRETLTWYTYVGMVKTIPAGSEIGYGGTYTTQRETVIATIPVGFGDGFSRQLSNRGFVTVRGQKAPIIGTVCMDAFMVDVTDIPGVTRGDVVTLLGGEMDAFHMADFLGVTLDEVVCGINKRVPRIYK